MDRTRLALTAVAAVLALPLVTAAQHTRPAPYGDRFATFAAPGAPAAGPVGVRIRGAAVEAYDRVTGAREWAYTRGDSRPLALRRAPGHAVALWADGIVTDTDTDTDIAGTRTGTRTKTGKGPDAPRRRVRWHRAVPGLGAWLAGRPERAAGVLQVLDPGARMIAVVTPERVSAFRTADGDLRWLLAAREGCAFDPARTAHTRGVLLLARPCHDRDSWSRHLAAVDGLGQITEGRTPLGNDLPGERRADGGGNRVAPPS
ncbi:hypothetical protein [Streptomyces sp. NBC_00083]|uniref:hypothetical protein n=1 Tax=Streptomyces sp. NBC_00083 TaxID=2975647 RepID=UPI002252A0E4|nr:hypothetical protein [Streptomyces sp. NBC_00083]MCX5383207.1 hypothetical protein [Streptomyces sp. NBC_00083]